MKKIFLLTICLLLAVTLPVAAGLKGKVIIVNPGHGGGETGAVGLKGLEENQINLKIGLYLRQMLEDAGATVYMTREDNYDLNGTDHYSGTRDRFNRLQLGREKDADIFLALHHNSSVNRDSDQIEVYYMPKYYGPSQDLAEYVLEGLKAEMELNGIATTMSQLIVNHATIPTIIGEASYISNPEMEKWFRNDANLKKVARGYFTGVKRFFEVGMPKIQPVSPGINEKLSQEASSKLITWITTDGESAIDPDSIRVFLDQQVIKHNYDPKTGFIEAQVEEPQANGPHHLLVIGANQAGIAAVPADFTFYVDEKPEAIVLDAYPTYIPGQQSIVKIAGQILDKNGQPVMDGNQVRFEVDGGTFDRDWVFTENGRFFNYLRWDGSSSIAGIRIWAADQLQEIVVDYRSQDAYLRGLVIDSLTGRLFADARVILANDEEKYETHSDSEGHYFFSEIQPGKYELRIIAKGYEFYTNQIQLTSSEVAQHNVEITPMAGGVLMGRKIILNTAVEGSTGQDSILLSILRVRLTLAGAEALTNTRGTDDKSTVKLTNKVVSDFLLSIKWTKGSEGIVYHYPRSEKYQKIASYISIPGLDMKIAESRSKLITFANTDSLIVEVPVGTPSEELAEALYQFFVQYFQMENE